MEEGGRDGCGGRGKGMKGEEGGGMRGEGRGEGEKDNDTKIEVLSRHQMFNVMNS